MPGRGLLGGIVWSGGGVEGVQVAVVEEFEELVDAVDHLGASHLRPP